MVHFENTSFDGTAPGKTVTLRWTNASGSVTIKMIRRVPTDLVPDYILVTSGESGTSYTWTVPSLIVIGAPGAYFFEVRDSSGSFENSPKFQITDEATGSTEVKTSITTTISDSTSTNSTSTSSPTAIQPTTRTDTSHTTSSTTSISSKVITFSPSTTSTSTAIVPFVVPPSTVSTASAASAPPPSFATPSPPTSTSFAISSATLEYTTSFSTPSPTTSDNGPSIVSDDAWVTPSSQPPTSLSTGVKAGIGAGISVGIIVIVGFAALFFGFGKSAAKRTQQAMANNPGAVGRLVKPRGLHSTSTRPELPSTNSATHQEFP